MPSKARIWVDGCFDFFHHGHAGALNQSRALGDALVVGIHTDEQILKNKGPVVMHLDERVYAVDACRWTSEEVSGAPYVTDPAVMDEYDCQYVAHGDDITTDADGNDTYQEVKDMGRFLEFKRTPNISTTDLISRMLSQSTAHHVDEQFLRSSDAQERFAMYAKASDARSPYSGVFLATHENRIEEFVTPAWQGKYPHSDIVYVEGAFDLFHCGHIEFLERVREDAAGEAPIVVGLRSDASVNSVRGHGRPIMNIFERALCVLQCKHVDAVILNVPYSESGADFARFLRETTGFNIKQVARGPTMHRSVDGVAKYADEKGILAPIDGGKYAHLRTETIVDRVLENREQYEERQRKKGVKSENEKKMEEAARSG